MMASACIGLTMIASATAIRLTTSTTLPTTSVASAHAFLATPSNWPNFVLSSCAVRSNSNDVTQPFTPGMVVDEVFGLPPILPLEVTWECVEADVERGKLSFAAPDGLRGIAKDCMMDFTIRSDGVSGCTVDLAMSYEATNPLAVAALPVLNLDNTIAVQLALPRALAKPVAKPAKSSLGTTDPIAGPIIAVSRRVGLLPEAEEDGWTGEPTAWANADSIPQKLSALSQKYLGGFKQKLAELVAGEFDVVTADAKIETMISSNGVAFFSFTNCPFCKQAKELLDAKGATYTLLELDEDEMGAGLRARLGARCGRTVSQTPLVMASCAACDQRTRLHLSHLRSMPDAASVTTRARVFPFLTLHRALGRVSLPLLTLHLAFGRVSLSSTRPGIRRAQSVPSIWIGGECIGGLNDGSPGLVPLDRSGELEPRLRSVGAME